MSEHESYMETAIELARSRPAQPFAALLVERMSGEVIAQGVNTTSMNPLLHGEIVCLNNAAAALKHFAWGNTILYTTAEPCCMCQAAILWAGIPEVIFGASVPTLRALGWNQFTLRADDVRAAAPFAECSLIGGVLEERCDALFHAAAEIRRARESSDS